MDFFHWLGVKQPALLPELKDSLGMLLHISRRRPGECYTKGVKNCAYLLLTHKRSMRRQEVQLCSYWRRMDRGIHHLIRSHLYTGIQILSLQRNRWYLPSGLFSPSVYISCVLSLLHFSALKHTTLQFFDRSQLPMLRRPSVSCELPTWHCPDTPIPNAWSKIFIHKALTMFPILLYKILLFPSCYYCRVAAKPLTWLQP